ncbi:ABC transporter ATP-binding protein [Paramaledivibacter caminithermalis]|jgi:ABC-2 type transport system ATP-binding protein|uniref:ABC-2 type transport system ATP-binding protein n=1 Tax=Paramaledivibacter caminithermalis (strain DSM 15212 / CIP 107654 / DViRD3) TaxID=1121301 RepID=A0A1M6SBC0_PARC5|nr:ABC transporter ATP-binding protein [Paramaledivibacter caminithermalis]SHK42006.1 ABC-2 type transport system ATP-binding protein [Paramaledivibacter caminithermalis DSM 15212]
MSKNILEIEGISKTFLGNFKAVQNLSLKVEEGEVCGFLGPNGAGKTTTIRMILGLIKPDDGNVFIDGHSIKEDKLTALKKVGALVEGPAFYEYLSGRDNLKAFAAYSGDIPQSRIEDVLGIVGLSDRGKDKVRHYSYGMKQRLGIAQALLIQPRLLILDEPTNGLDPHGIQEIRLLIKRLSKETGVTILLSSHILAEVEQICNKVAIIDKGVLKASGDVKQLLNPEKKIYEIASNDYKKLLKDLKSLNNITILKEHDEKTGNISFHTGNWNPEDVLVELVKKGSRITLFAPKKITLEDFFFQITKEEDD